MNLKDTKKLLEKASDLYYNTDKVILSDEEYDDIYKKYIDEVKKKNLNIKDYDVQGSKPKTNKETLSIKHEYENLAGTLSKTNSLDDAKEFIMKQIDLFHNKPFKIVYDLKYDGNSVIGEYDNGKPYSFLTRGKDGLGMDLLDVFKTNKIFIKEPCAIKYEAIIEYNKFDKLLTDKNLSYANPRSSISGILGKNDAKDYKDYITLVPLEIRYKNNNTFFNNIKNRRIMLDDLNYVNHMKVFNSSKPLETIEDIEKVKKFAVKKLEEFYNDILKKRNNLPCMIDGLVIGVYTDDILNTEKYVNNIPSFTLALKFPYLEKTSTVTDFSFTVGESGRITPNVHFKPLEFNGTKHTKQSLQNYKRFKELNLGIGSKILVQFRNDVLTYIQKIDTDENKKIKPYEYPNVCPVCGGDITIESNNIEDTLSYCDNIFCPATVIGRYTNYLKKISLKKINKATIEKLYENNLLDGSIKSLYNLDKGKFFSIKGLSESSWKILNEELKNKSLYDYEILGSLGIRNLSLETAKEFCKRYKLKEFIKDIETKDKIVLLETIKNIDNFSDILSNTLINGINNNILDIKFLLNFNSKSYLEELESNRSDNFEPLSIVFTGFRDSEFKNYLELKGHKVNTSVSSKTDVLVVKDKFSNSSKILKAKELSIEILSIEEAKKKL